MPIDNSALRSAELIEGATLKVYPGADHGLATHKGQLNANLLALIKR